MGIVVYLGVLLVVAFLLYVCVFGGSSSGWIGGLHHTLTSCPCLKPCLNKIFGPRCWSALRRVEDVCCWRPNPLLQLFYLGLMGGGFVLFYLHTLPHIPNSRLPAWHRYSSYLVMLTGLTIFILASFADPGTVTAASLHRFSRVPFDGVVPAPPHAACPPLRESTSSSGRGWGVGEGCHPSRYLVDDRIASHNYAARRSISPRCAGRVWCHARREQSTAQSATNAWRGSTTTVHGSIRVLVCVPRTYGSPKTRG